MTYSAMAGDGSYPTYNSSAELTISLTQTARGTEFQFLKSSTATNTNDAGVFRILEKTTLLLTDVASIPALANQGTIAASSFGQVIEPSGALGTVLGTTNNTGSLGDGNSYIAANLYTQSFALSSAPEPSSADLLGGRCCCGLYPAPSQKTGGCC